MSSFSNPENDAFLNWSPEEALSADVQPYREDSEPAVPELELPYDSEGLPPFAYGAVMFGVASVASKATEHFIIHNRLTESINTFFMISAGGMAVLAAVESTARGIKRLRR